MGDLQRTGNGCLCGILAILGAVGFWLALDKRALSAFCSCFVFLVGIGLILAGIFSTDPAFGFPKGAPEGYPAHPSLGALIHSLGFYTAFTALSFACFLFSRQFHQKKMPGWEAYSLVSGFATPILIALGMTVFSEIAGIAFAVVGVSSLGWMSLVARNFQQATTRRS